MNNRDIADRVLVRMSIDIAWLTMGSPPGMTNTDCSSLHFLTQALSGNLQPADAAFLLHNKETFIQQGDPCGIIPSIFKPLQPFQKKRNSLTPPYISNYSTHNLINFRVLKNLTETPVKLRYDLVYKGESVIKRSSFPHELLQPLWQQPVQNRLYRKKSRRDKLNFC